MSTTFNAHQQVFGLSLLANAIRSATGTQAYLQTLAEQTVAKYLATTPGLNGWICTWGPVVWKHNPNDATTGPDNVWFGAYNSRVIFPDGGSRSLAVVAIAATAPGNYDWIFEDLEVQYVVDFMQYVKSVGTGIAPIQVPRGSINDLTGTYISLATAHGLFTLDSVPAPATANGAGSTLLQGLAGTPGYAHIVFTGHSLGGALSPALGLAYAQSGKLPQVMSLMTYPSAGATPGNGNFVKLYSSTFPRIDAPVNGKPYQTWNVNAVNMLDVVPHAWCTIGLISELNLLKIPTIYGKPAVKDVQDAVDFFEGLSISSEILYTPIPYNPFPGIPPKSVPTTTGQFFAQVGIEHGQAYADWVGIPLPPSPPSEVPPKHKPGVQTLVPDENQKEVSAYGA